MSVLYDYFLGPRAYQSFWYAFLIILPFSWRKVILPSVTGGQFNEYLDISLYVGDILILSTFLLLIKHKKLIKSIYDRKFHVEQLVGISFIVYIFLSFLWSSSTLLWADSMIVVVRCVLVFFVFSHIINESRNQDKFLKYSTLSHSMVIFGISVIFQAFLAIIQFYLNHSLGFFILNESNISSIIPGIAKIDFSGWKHIRAYGTFLHPNILAGYALIIMLINIHWFSLFHVKQLLVYVVFPASIACIVLAFSKGAIISLIISMLFLLFHVEQKKRGMFHVEQILLAVSITILSLFIVFSAQMNWEKSISERLIIYKNYASLDRSSSLGSGLGQLVYQLSASKSVTDQWLLQPVHNIYIILYNELGIIGVLLFGLYVILTVPRGTLDTSFLPVLSILIIGFFDHYFIDIYVGNVLMALAFAWWLQMSRNVNILTK